MSTVSKNMTTETKQALRSRLRTANTNAWNNESNLNVADKSLDTSLKKNTTFIRKIRASTGAEAIKILIKDFESISLAKYTSELTDALVETLSKCKTLADVLSAVELVSVIHQRFPTLVTRPLIYNMVKMTSSINKETFAAQSRLQQLQQEQESSAQYSALLIDKQYELAIINQRVFFRLIIEFWLCGIIRSSALDLKSISNDLLTSLPLYVSSKKLSTDSSLSNEPLPLEILTMLIMKDNTDFNCTSLITMIFKSFASVFGNIPSSKTGQNLTSQSQLESDEQAPSDDKFPSQDIIEQFQDSALSYFKELRQYLTDEHISLKKQAASNKKSYIRVGKIIENTEDEYKASLVRFRDLQKSAQALATALKLPPLEFKDDESLTPKSSIRITNSLSSGSDNGRLNENDSDISEDLGIWEDKEEKYFYEKIPNLADLIPELLPSDKNDDDSSQNQETTNNEDDSKIPTGLGPKGNKKARFKEMTELMENMNSDQNGNDHSTSSLYRGDDYNNLSIEKEQDEDEASFISSKLSGMEQHKQIKDLLLELLTITNVNRIDEFAVNFYKLSSKIAIKKLIEILSFIRASRIAFYPYFARLIAILSPYIPEIADKVATNLLKRWKGLQFNKNSAFNSTRLATVRYLSELAKCDVVPYYVILYCFKNSVEYLDKCNIVCVCGLLEGCGRFLLSQPSTSKFLAQYVKILKKKRLAINLFPNEEMMIDFALESLKPPERNRKAERKYRPPVYEYILDLLHLRLREGNYDFVLEQVRKLNWKENETIRWMFKACTKPWRLPVNNIKLVARLLYDLSSYYPEFTVIVVDKVLEEVRFGLEHNIFKYSQRRVSVIQYLGELYLSGCVSFKTILDTLFLIITFGHSQGFPRPANAIGGICKVDMPDDYFRIRLACNLLNVIRSNNDNEEEEEDHHGKITKIRLSDDDLKILRESFFPFFEYYVWTKEQPLPFEIWYSFKDECKSIFSENYDPAKSFAEALSKFSGKPVDEILAEQAAISASKEKELRKKQSKKNKKNKKKTSFMEEFDEDDYAQLAQKELLDAQFEREYAEMISGDMGTRKYERSAKFDEPIPMFNEKTSNIDNFDKDNTILEIDPKKIYLETDNEDGLEYNQKKSNEKEIEKVKSKESPSDSDYVKFRILTKVGNRKQIKELDVPIDEGIATRVQEYIENESVHRKENKRFVMDYVESIDYDEDDLY